jgi:hypothetical protein
VGVGPCPAAVDDAIDSIIVDLLGLKIEAELFAHYASEEAADRVLLPMGGADDGSNRRSLRSAQHGQHASLFRALPAFARGASFALRLAQLLLLTREPLCRSRNPLARGDGLGCRRFDLGGSSRTKLVEDAEPKWRQAQEALIETIGEDRWRVMCPLLRDTTRMVRHRAVTAD